MTTNIPPQPWKTGICDCTCEECSAANYGSVPCCNFFPGYSMFDLFGETYAKLTGLPAEQLASDYCWDHYWSLTLDTAVDMRKRLREKYNLEGDSYGAWCAYAWCSICAVWQDTREVAIREAEAASKLTVVQAPAQVSMEGPPWGAFHGDLTRAL